MKGIKSMKNQKIANDIKDFLSNHINIENLGLNEDIFLSGYVNSLFAMQLVMFVETNFGIKVNNEDLEIKNFNTIINLSTYVEKKLDIHGQYREKTGMLMTC